MSYVRCKKCFLRIWLLPTIISESVPSRSPCGWVEGIQNAACLAYRCACEYSAEDYRWEEAEDLQTEWGVEKAVHLLLVSCCVKGCASAIRILLVGRRGATVLHAEAVAASLLARNVRCADGHRNIGPVLDLSSISLTELLNFGG